MTTRRGFLGMLAGVATAATFASRFPLLPPPPPELLTGEVGRYEGFTIIDRAVKPAAFEVGLLRVCTEEVQRELRAFGYCRVAPTRVTNVEGGMQVLATFPTVTYGRWRTRGAGLFAPDGQLLFYQRWTGGWGEPINIDLSPGNTIQAMINVSFRPDFVDWAKTGIA